MFITDDSEKFFRDESEVISNPLGVFPITFVKLKDSGIRALLIDDSLAHTHGLKCRADFLKVFRLENYSRYKFYLIRNIVILSPFEQSFWN